MTSKINIFLDDLRDTPDGFVRVSTVEETIYYLKLHQGNVGILSLDNDLGEGLDEGYKVADWIEEQVFVDPNFVPPDEIRVHSANSVRRKHMEAAIQNIYWKL